MDRLVIFVTTEHGPTEITNLLRERGMGELLPGALSFIDAFGETVGATTPERPDTVGANCEDLTSISLAIVKLQERIGRRDVLLAFDSLTSPYLFNEKEMFRFMRMCLAKFASERNSVLASMDEGYGKEEDLGAMMSARFFTTGFLNGFFSAVKNQHVRETKCIGMGHPYCEWEFR